MSGRLFTEVREKRGLCYSVWAGYSSLKGLGCILGYAGTSNERAQATLDCFISELHRLTQGVTTPNCSGPRSGSRPARSCRARALPPGPARSPTTYFIRGRIRTLEEIKDAIDAVTVDQVNAYLKSTRRGRLRS